MKFSISTGCFYPDSIAYDAIPDDAVDASDEDFALCMARAADETIVYADGKFSLAKSAGPTEGDLQAAAKARARVLLAATDYTQAADVAALISNGAAFSEYRAALRAIFRSPTTDPAWPAVPDPVWS